MTLAPTTTTAEALADQQSFTRAQVAWLMSQAYRWGYEQHDAETCDCHAEYWAQRVAEEEEKYPAPKVFTLGRWYDQATRRAQHDQEARKPRPGDFQPGTVAAQW